MALLVNQILLTYGKNIFATFSLQILVIVIKKNEIMAKLENIQHTDDMTVSCVDISHLISQLKCGKAAGSDDLCAEYFKFVHNRLHILLSMCFTLFFTHSYLPA